MGPLIGILAEVVTEEHYLLRFGLWDIALSVGILVAVFTLLGKPVGRLSLKAPAKTSQGTRIQVEARLAVPTVESYGLPPGSLYASSVKN